MTENPVFAGACGVILAHSPHRLNKIVKKGQEMVEIGGIAEITDIAPDRQIN